MIVMQDKKSANAGTDSKRYEPKGKRRTYVKPQVLSTERLEAAAATCQPQTGAFGKTVPVPCGTLGS